MKFTAIFIALAAVATVKAAAVDTNLLAELSAPDLADNPETLNGFPQCKPLLQSCAVNSECCSDLCLLGLCT
ncbi:hypothetical protein DFH08DRAFT_839617 [Mycena albidolilacea]|uniref:Uncharacterized protein n=1 Tax=Mycena albidolilacea TaxID=1033008 RepID=A0AAD7AQ08_9AGAR|nr:hypothetical protein DFH08DRAFT_839617 [Mycena albidolilacea]